ncbi:hypothetical protein GE061_006365 [Apolygus lucorum]|uniref:Uncharacterized protein n=1 Tax=Apolygus lucorum TaxID=248454 RepID=A0A8S9WXN1_APOLU|nr:hypothetical protein GE061_006365 [Apolygus lucorum]
MYWIDEKWRPRDDLHEAYTAMRKAQQKAEADAKAHMKKPKTRQTDGSIHLKVSNSQ